MSAINFNTSNQTFRQLLGNGLTYHIPQFQRDYSWTETEWEDLWQDIIDMFSPDGEPAHYMGYLVLQTANNKAFDIIDGQQRLTTLSLLVLAVLKNLQDLVDQDTDALNNHKRLEQLRNSYIGFLDPVTLTPQSKLNLNRNNNLYYQNYLVPLDRLPKRGLKASEHLLRKAFEWFVERIRNQYKQSDGADLARLVDTFSDRLFFTVITVTDELNAFKVFETLNARGVRLSATDLLKNYLFSIVHRDGAHENDIKALDDRWVRIVDQLGSEKFPDFLRVHWNSRHRFVRRAEFFKTIRRNILDRQDVFRLLREIEEDADIYVALLQSEDSLWDENSEQREAVAELRLFNVRQPFSLLLATKRALANSDFTRILRACSIISFRYNTISGLSPNEQERVYNRIAYDIAHNNLVSAKAILQEMRTIYVSDERFRNAFAEKQLRTTTQRNKRIVRYILFHLERQLTNHDYDPDSRKYTIEHILPEKVGDEWPEFSDSEIEQFIYRLGNMTLLEAKQNRGVGNDAFFDKQAVFKESQFELTRRVEKENNEWTAKRIANRQRWMAKQAVGIWKISQLS